MAEVFRYGTVFMDEMLRCSLSALGYFTYPYFKFNCKDEGVMSASQKRKYDDALGVEPDIIHKDGRKCP